MPAAAAVEARATSVLGTPGSPDYNTAKDIVHGATSLTDAVVTNAFFLSPLSQADQDEVAGMLALLPGNVAQGVLGALDDDLQRDARIVFTWNEHPDGEFDYSHVRGDDNVGHLELRTPPGPPRFSGWRAR
jgi:hypothetical protein